MLITWVIRYLDANERDCFRLNQTVVGGLRKMMMMVESMFTVIIIFGFYVVGKSEIYIVTIQGEPVTSYRGGVDGFEATAVDSDETLDVTRIVFFEPFFYKQVLTVPITQGMQFVTHRSGSQEDHIQQPEQSLKKCGREMKEGDQSKLLGGLAASRACYGVLNRYVDPLALKLPNANIWKRCCDSNIWNAYLHLIPKTVPQLKRRPSHLCDSSFVQLITLTTIGGKT